MGVLFFPWLRLLPAQFGKVTQSYWVPLPSVVTFVQTAIVFGFWTDNQAASPLLAAAMLAGSLLILSLVAHQLLRGKKDWTSSLGLCLMVLLMPVVVLVLVSIFLKPVYIIRALMPSQIAFLILAAWMAVRLPRPIQIVSAGLLGLILAAAIAAHYRYQGFPRAPWDQVEAYLQQNAQPEDLVLHDNKLTYFPMAVLSPRLEQDYLPDLAGIGSDTLAPATQRVLGQLALEPDQPIAPHERIWFLIFERTREDYRQAGFVDDPYWLLLAENHAPQPPIRFADLELVLFVQEEGE
jgi:hypothetical protein